MLIILITLVIMVILLVLFLMMLNLYLGNRNKVQIVWKDGKKSHTTQLHEMLFQRKNHTDTLDMNDYE